MTSNRPQTGGRVVLELLSSGAEVVYAGTLLTPDGEWAGRGVVTVASGEVAWTWNAGAPPWLADLAHKFVRGEWRARRGDDPEPWPARITRWRAAP